MPPEPAPFSFSQHDGIEVVRLTQAKMPHPVLESLQKELHGRIEAGARKLVINLEPVAFLDSFGLGVVAASARRVAQLGGRLILCGVGERVKMSLTITRLDRHIEMAADEQDALGRLGLAS